MFYKQEECVTYTTQHSQYRTSGVFLARNQTRQFWRGPLKYRWFAEYDNNTMK